MKALNFFAVLLSIGALPAAANILPYPSSFSVQEIRANGTTLHVRVGGTGPAVVLLHGFVRISRMSVQSFTACRSNISVDVGPGFHGMSVQDDAGGWIVSESSFDVNDC